MGYFSHFRGEISIKPHLNYQQVKLANPDVYKDHEFRVQTDSEDRETEEGVLEVIYGYAIACTTDEGIRGYQAVNEIQRIVNLFWKDHDFEGEIRVEGEEAGDVRRIFVDDDGMVVQWKAELLWPDGTTERGRK